MYHMKREKKSLEYDYSKYVLTPGETALSILIWIFISAFLAFFFYRSVLSAFIIFAFFPLFLKYVKNVLKEARQWKMTLEFREMIKIISSDIQAGNSVENAMYYAYREMASLYGKDSYMTKECGQIVRGIENNMVIESLFMSLGERSAINEIRDFSGIFLVAKRSGGNLKDIIADTVDVIDMKTELKREFRVLLSSKRLEHRIMCVVPFFILIYIGSTSKGYFDCLYHNTSGVLIMTVCMAVYVGAFLWGERILNIKI